MAGKRKDKNGRILKAGESQRQNGAYQYRYKDIRGISRYIYAKTLDELRRKEADVNRDLLDGIDYSAGEITLLQLVEMYLSQKQGMRYNTRSTYQFVLTVLKDDAIASRKIKTIKQSDLKRWVIRLHDAEYKRSTIELVKRVLKPAFDMAVQDDAIRKNPFLFALSEVIPNDTEKRDALTKGQQQALLNFLQTDSYGSRYYDDIVILLGTGMRISELYGLTQNDIDFRKHRINVEKQLQRTAHGEYYIQKPKTESGIRKIPMSEDVETAFRRVIASRPAPSIDIIGGYTGFLFLDRNGKPKVAQHLQAALKHVTKKYNASHEDGLDVTPHTLRHTFCTNMVDAGMQANALQYIMGHANITMTLGTYTHIGAESAQAAFLDTVQGM